MSPSPSALPTSPLRLAAVQAEAVCGDVPGNARRAAAQTTLAAGEGAKVVVFPELHLCAYDLQTLTYLGNRGVICADASGRVVDQRLDPLVEAAADRAVTVLIGAAVRHEDGRRTNSVLAVDPAGTVTVAYNKQHLWHQETDLFSPGVRGAILTIGDWRVGLGVCYDISFPEHGRAASLAGAHAYLCPGAFAAGCEHRAGIYLAARALENTIYAVFANPVGGPKHRPCSGGTAVYGPDGSTICQLKTNREGVLIADLDPQELARVRGFLRMLEECRSAASSGPAWADAA